MKLSELRPPNRRWAIVEGSVLAIALLWTLFSALPSAAPVHALAPQEPLLSPITKSTREQLLQLFPATPLTASAKLQLLARISTLIDDRGLILESRALEKGPKMIPNREVHRLLLSGPAPSQGAFVRDLTTFRAPIRIRELTWSAGIDGDHRQLELVMEVFVE